MREILKEHNQEQHVERVENANKKVVEKEPVGKAFVDMNQARTNKATSEIIHRTRKEMESELDGMESAWNGFLKNPSPQGKQELNERLTRIQNLFGQCKQVLGNIHPKPSEPQSVIRNKLG